MDQALKLYILIARGLTQCRPYQSLTEASPAGSLHDTNQNDLQRSTLLLGARLAKQGETEHPFIIAGHEYTGFCKLPLTVFFYPVKNHGAHELNGEPELKADVQKPLAEESLCGSLDDRVNQRHGLTKSAMGYEGLPWKGAYFGSSVSMNVTRHFELQRSGPLPANKQISAYRRLIDTPQATKRFFTQVDV